ncbi:hypothetical protein [Wolbachia endosymbiont of Ctenocephalides felis wCfeT]|uniref:hypothetical protein n=1 Tax=Wolbachia endosymbiont of Ctenocephalides felis wCfeT TaxID=2732593 RepID=UPI0014481295|nr:hypothetical protein [Wolbachia endosymbiont of Ctenocephalides felis wCfeT]
MTNENSLNNEDSLNKELVKSFNLIGYRIYNASTNCTVKDGKICSAHYSNVDNKYLAKLNSETREWYNDKDPDNKNTKGPYNKDTEEKSSYTGFFPFNVYTVKYRLDKGGRIKELMIDIDPEVIFNLKVHTAMRLQKDGEMSLATRLEELNKQLSMNIRDTRECVSKFAQIEPSPNNKYYLYCISFDDQYIRSKYPVPGLPEFLKKLYMEYINLMLGRCGIGHPVFYEDRGDKLYIKDITDINVVRKMGEYFARSAACDLDTPASQEFKIAALKNALKNLIYNSTKTESEEGIIIDGFDRHNFNAAAKENGDHFAWTPSKEVNGVLCESLSSRDASRINKALKDNFISNTTGKAKEELGDFIIDIREKINRETAENKKLADAKKPVFAFSNKSLAKLLPILMESPIAYNHSRGFFEWKVEPNKHMVNYHLPTVPNQEPEEESSESLPFDKLLQRLQQANTGSGQKQEKENSGLVPPCPHQYRANDPFGSNGSSIASASTSSFSVSTASQSGPLEKPLQSLRQANTGSGQKREKESKKSVQPKRSVVSKLFGLRGKGTATERSVSNLLSYPVKSTFNDFPVEYTTTEESEFTRSKLHTVKNLTDPLNILEEVNAHISRPQNRLAVQNLATGKGSSLGSHGSSYRSSSSDSSNSRCGLSSTSSSSSVYPYGFGDSALSSFPASMRRASSTCSMLNHPLSTIDSCPSEDNEPSTEVKEMKQPEQQKQVDAVPGSSTSNSHLKTILERSSDGRSSGSSWSSSGHSEKEPPSTKVKEIKQPKQQKQVNMEEPSSCTIS